MVKSYDRRVNFHILHLNIAVKDTVYYFQTNIFYDGPYSTWGKSRSPFTGEVVMTTQHRLFVSIVLS